MWYLLMGKWAIYHPDSVTRLMGLRGGVQSGLGHLAHSLSHLCSRCQVQEPQVQGIQQGPGCLAWDLSPPVGECQVPEPQRQQVQQHLGCLVRFPG